MKSQYLIILLITSLNCGCSNDDQNSKSNSNQFKITIVSTAYGSSNANTLIERIELDTGILDIFFFNKKYHIPSDLPVDFYSSEHKDVLITTTHHPNDTIYKYETMIKYDSIGRVIQYSEFPSIISSSGGFNYFVNYNDKGQIETIEDSVIQLLSRNMKYEFDYFEDGSIKEIREYKSLTFGNEPTKVVSVQKKIEH